MRALVLVVVAALLGAAPAATQQPPGEVLAVGGPATMHAQALDRVAQAVGVAPVQLGGQDRYATAVAISQRTHPTGAEVVYLASGRHHPDALAAGPLLAGGGGVLLLTDPDALPQVVGDELVRLAPGRVVLLGGPAAVSEDVADQVAALSGRRPDRLAGPDRYATAQAISRQAHPDGADTVYVASGEGWSDALVATTAVDAHDGALLLTAPQLLPGATAQELVRLAPSTVVVLGGPAAISQAVADRIGAVTGRRPERLAGPDRYATAQAISRHAHPDGVDTVYAATGLDWADALAAGSGVAADDAALLLIDTTVHWPAPDLTAAVEVAGARAGTTSLAVIGTDGVMAGHLAERTVAAASTLKVMFMAAYLRQPSVRDRDLGADDLALLEPMITRSANAEASRIADVLGPGPLHVLAAEAGMQDFAYTRPWGNSRTSARDQARLMLVLDDLLPERHSDYAMDLLRRIVPEQRWGIGQLDLPGWQVHFKGGWGSGTGSVDHQVVRLQRQDGTVVALAVMTTASPSHEYATDTLQAVFEQLLATLP